MRFIHIPLFIALLALCGCDKDAQTLDEKEERNQLVKTGQSYVEIKDWEKAENAFKQAIENNPRMARPHLDLALIYQQYKVDYIYAIYHYDRYLELRPDAEKAGFIREQRAKVEQALAHHYINQSAEVGKLADGFKRLQQENAGLRQRLASRPATASSPAPRKSVTQTVPKSAKPTATVRSTHRIYTVVAGDNLTKIAEKFYGNDDYMRIYEANKDRMKGPGDLRVGQTLVIPNRAN